MKLPKRINDLPSEERRKAAIRFHLAIAAAHVAPDCTLKGLAIAAGLNPNYLWNIARGADNLSLKVAMAIEAVAGRDICSRADLLPEIFDYEDGATHVE